MPAAIISPADQARAAPGRRTIRRRRALSGCCGVEAGGDGPQ